MIEFTEYNGNFEIVRQSEIIIYNDNEVSIELRDNSDILILKIQFQNRGGRVSSIEQKLNENILTFQFINFEKEDSLGGIFEPIKICELNNGTFLYFNCLVYTVNTKDGYRVLKYSFLKQKEHHEMDL